MLGCDFGGPKAGSGGGRGAGSAASRFGAFPEAKTPFYGAILGSQKAAPEAARRPAGEALSRAAGMSDAGRQRGGIGTRCLRVHLAAPDPAIQCARRFIYCVS